MLIEKTSMPIHGISNVESKLLEKDIDVIKLKDKLLLYSDLFDLSTINYQLLDKNGYIVETNNEFADLLGYNLKELKGKWMGNYLSERSKLDIQQIFQEFKLGNKISLRKIEFKSKNGKLLQAKLEGKVRRGIDGEVMNICFAIKDIVLETKGVASLYQKATEQAIDSVADKLNVGFFSISVESYGKYKLTNVDPILRELLGIENGSIEKGGLNHLLSSQELWDNLDLANSCNECYRKKECVVERMPFVRKGMKVWLQKKLDPVMVNNEVTRIIGMVALAQNQERNEFPAERTKGKWDSFVLNTPDIVCLVNLNFKIDYINKVDYGFSPLNFIGKDIFKFYNDKDRIKGYLRKL